MWKKYFKVIKVRPGRILTSSHGELDFSADNISIEICQQLYEDDFPYLEITEEGKRELYGIEQVTEFVEADQVFEPLPPAEENPGELKTSIPIRPDVPVSEPYSTSKKRNGRSSK